jgi:hypothetical protein
VTSPSDADIAERLRAILGTPEFHKRFSDYAIEEITKGLKEIFHWLQRLSPVMRWWLFAVCVLLLAAIVLQTWLLLRSAKHSLRVASRNGQLDLDFDVGEGPEAIAARARKLAGAGRFREAARALQQAALLRLARERGLPWRPELADWEWVAMLRGASGLGELTRATQRLAYGPDAAPEAFASCDRLYLALTEKRA